MIPIADSNRSSTFPWVTVTIIVINFVVFFYEIALSQTTIRGSVTELDRFIFRWGTIPACTLDALGRSSTEARSAICTQQPHPAWTVFSAMFIHSGWLHIIGNMVFLWIFGDNVEDAMGHARYLVFYLAVGVLATAAYMAVSPAGLTPAVGASGAIAGVMGAYLVLFPRATVAVIIPIFFFIPFPLPAFVLIGFWFIAQLFNGVSSLGPDAVGGGGVAYFAHIGGFVSGAALVGAFAVHRTRATSRPARLRLGR
ncbi:MAG: rhomboid family intramembrane serine protease [Chloroflexi bacterium]|nr:rhomboid family intramembrane serine protease [Chloroflexota bacterium]